MPNAVKLHANVRFVLRIWRVNRMLTNVSDVRMECGVRMRYSNMERFYSYLVSNEVVEG